MSDNNHTSSPEGFFYQPKTIQWILRIFYGLCVLLVGVDFIIHRHIETPIEKIPAFYAMYGFAACVILVLIANQMRKVIMRSEYYYDLEEYEPEKHTLEEPELKRHELEQNGTERHKIDRTEPKGKEHK